MKDHVTLILEASYLLLVKESKYTSSNLSSKYDQKACKELRGRGQIYYSKYIFIVIVYAHLVFCTYWESSLL